MNCDVIYDAWTVPVPLLHQSIKTELTQLAGAPRLAAPLEVLQQLRAVRVPVPTAVQAVEMTPQLLTSGHTRPAQICHTEHNFEVNLLIK